MFIAIKVYIFNINFYGMLNISKILDLLPMGLAILAGILTYRKLTLFYRILFIQVFIYTAIDLFSISVPGNNAWVYNISMIIEIGLVLLASMMYFKTKNSRLIISLLFFVFLSILGIDIYIQKISEFAVHAYLFGGISITGIYLLILFSHFFEKKDNYQSFALTITCLGIVLYFACMAPYLSMMNRLQAQNADENKSLFILIIGSLGQFRYFLIAVAFFIHWKLFQLKKPY